MSPPVLRCTSTGAPTSRRGTSSRSSAVRSGTEMIGARVVVCVLLLTPAAPAAAGAAQDVAPRGVTAPDAAAIGRALARVKADPNLATSRTIKTLRWRPSATRSSGTRAWLQWVVGLFRWFARGARLLVWCAAVVLAGMLRAYIYPVVPPRVARPAPGQFVPPPHVQDVALRRESLPDDIGAAARGLWDRGDHR